MMKAIYFSILTVLTLSGCAFSGSNVTYLNGIDPQINAGAVKTSTENQDTIIKAFVTRANEGANARANGLPENGSEAWDNVIAAGFDYVDEECAIYVNALFWADRSRSTLVKQLGLAAASTGTIVGLTGGSANTLALIAAAFGLVTGFADNQYESVLFKLNPAAVSAVIENSMLAYRKEVLRGPENAKDDTERRRRSRPGAAAAIRGYVSLCVPAGIERQVNASLTNQTFDAEGGATPLVTPAGTRGAEAPELARRVDAAVTRLENFDTSQGVNEEPGGNCTPNARGRIENALACDQISQIQRALCVQSDTILGPQTREAINEWRRGLSSSGVLSDSALDEGLNFDEARYLRRTAGCSALGYRTPFERALLRDQLAIRDTLTPDAVRTSGARRLATIAGRLDVNPEPGSNVPNNAIRNAIKDRRGTNDDGIDSTFYLSLFQ